jgi:hypothetical protein
MITASGGLSSGSAAENWAICTERSLTCPFHAAFATNSSAEDERDRITSFLNPAG